MRRAGREPTVRAAPLRVVTIWALARWVEASGRVKLGPVVEGPSSKYQSACRTQHARLVHMVRHCLTQVQVQAALVRSGGVARVGWQVGWPFGIDMRLTASVTSGAPDVSCRCAIECATTSSNDEIRVRSEAARRCTPPAWRCASIA